MTIWTDAASTLWPGRDRDGPLPPLLLLLTVLTGLVDAVSFLGLGHVFVANMTGNIVFLGFAVAGASGISIWASAVALGAFLLGGLAGGRLGVRLASHRGLLLRAALGVQIVAVAAALAVAALGGDPVDGARRYVLIALLAVATGVQNAVVRRLAVPELTTTVLTMTLTGVAADSRLAGGPGSRLGRRSLAVAAMFTGALIGGLLVIRVDITAAVAAAVGVLAVALGLAHRVSGTGSDWAQARGR